MESKKYKFTKRQREKSKIIIRPNKNKILERLLEKNIIMRRGDIMPYTVKDSNKHMQNVIKKNAKGNAITTWAISKEYRALHYAPCLGEDPQKIVDYFNSKIYAIQSYYKYCDQYYKLSQIFRILKFSCLKTLANKYRCGTISMLYKKFGNNLQKIIKRNIVHFDTKKVPIMQYLMKTKKNTIEKNAVYENFEEDLNAIWITDIKSSFGSCSICNSTEKLESHYVKSVKDLRAKIKRQGYNYYNYKYILEKAERFFEILHVIRKKKNK